MDGEKYSFEFLEDFKPTPWQCWRRLKCDDEEKGHQNDHWGPKNFERSNHPLNIMVSHYNCTLWVIHNANILSFNIISSGVYNECS